MEVKSDEVPFADENYYFRQPSQVGLRKGWNTVLVKIPVQASTWKRMFTFVPVDHYRGQAREVEGLRYSAQFEQ